MSLPNSLHVKVSTSPTMELENLLLRFLSYLPSSYRPRCAWNTRDMDFPAQDAPMPWDTRKLVPQLLSPFLQLSTNHFFCIHFRCDHRPRHLLSPRRMLPFGQMATKFLSYRQNLRERAMPLKSIRNRENGDACGGVGDGDHGYVVRRYNGG